MQGISLLAENQLASQEGLCIHEFSLLIYSLSYFLVLLQSVPAPSFWIDYLFCTLAYNSKQFRVLSTEILSKPSTNCPKFSLTLKSPN